jgi:hypothetical protein
LKNDFSNWQAWLRLQSLVFENIVISRLSENHAETFSASPCERYLDIGVKTSYPLSWAEAFAQIDINIAATSATSTFTLIKTGFRKAKILQIPNHATPQLRKYNW